MRHIRLTERAGSGARLGRRAGVCLLVLTLACSGDAPTEQSVADPATIYQRLSVEHKAIVLSVHAPYDTVQLRAAPVTIYGDTLPSEEAVQFRKVNVLDTSVTVSAQGLVKARGNTSGARVEVSLVVGGVLRADTVTIVVRNENPVRRIARMEFFPLAPDSGWRWAGVLGAVGYQSWVRLFTEAGAAIPTNQAIIAYSWDRETMIVQSAPLVGETYIHARVYAYGKVLADSFLFRRIDPPVRFVVIGRDVPANGEPRHRFYPDSLEMRQGSTVIFMNASGTSRIMTATCSGTRFCGNRLIRTQAFLGSSLEWVDSTDVIFDQPSAATAGTSFLRIQFLSWDTTPWPADGASGNIGAFALTQCSVSGSPTDNCGGRGAGTLDPGYRSRKFNTPGVYRYHSTRFPGAQGVVVVKAE